MGFLHDGMFERHGLHAACAGWLAGFLFGCGFRFVDGEQDEFETACVLCTERGFDDRFCLGAEERFEHGRRCVGLNAELAVDDGPVGVF